MLLRLEQDGLKADATTYSHQCTLQMMSGEREQALKMPQIVRDAGLKPIAKMYAGLINMCLRNNKGERAQMLLEQMEADNHFITQSLRNRVADGQRA